MFMLILSGYENKKQAVRPSSIKSKTKRKCIIVVILPLSRKDIINMYHKFFASMSVLILLIWNTVFAADESANGKAKGPSKDDLLNILKV